MLQKCTQDRRLCGFLLSLASAVVALSPAASYAESAGPLLKLLKSGRLPEERVGTVIEMVCKRGDAEDLAFVFEQVVSPEGYEGELRLQALRYLADAAESRRVKPEGDLAALGKLVDGGDSVDAKTRRAAIRLAGLWKVAALGEKLQQIVVSKDADGRLRQAATEALVSIGGADARQVFERLAEPGNPQEVRYTAAAALVGLGGENIGQKAAEILASGTDSTDPAPVVDAFLDVEGGADRLAAAIDKHPPPADVAKLALRHMYSIGRSDPLLVAALSKAAGIGSPPEPITKAESLELAAEVLAKGDAQRGEEIFRRKDLSCIKCHSLSKAGGNVGPDLSAVGGSSPVDYLVRSILMPDEAIKEQYASRIVITDEGKVIQGIVVDRDDTRLVLRDAKGKNRVIPIDSIDDEEEGKSLMPKGLANFLTHSELLDLVKFLSRLGKPGPYAVRSEPVMQRWRVLKSPGELLLDGVPDQAAFREKVLDIPAEHWLPAYGKVAGGLPLVELVSATGNEVLYIYGEVDVTEPGEVRIQLNSPEGTQLWLDESPLEPVAEQTVELSHGHHRITLRVDTTQRANPELKLTLAKPSGSSAQFTVVDGT